MFETVVCFGKCLACVVYCVQEIVILNAFIVFVVFVYIWKHILKIPLEHFLAKSIKKYPRSVNNSRTNNLFELFWDLGS